MGDVGDYWREHKEYKREQKRRQQAAIPKAMQVLDEAGIEYRRLDPYGEHYRVAGRFDWWPSTGYWKAVNGSTNGHRVRSLIRAVQAEKADAED